MCLVVWPLVFLDFRFRFRLAAVSQAYACARSSPSWPFWSGARDFPSPSCVSSPSLPSHRHSVSANLVFSRCPLESALTGSLLSSTARAQDACRRAFLYPLPTAEVMVRCASVALKALTTPFFSFDTIPPPFCIIVRRVSWEVPLWNEENVSACRPLQCCSQAYVVPF